MINNDTDFFLYVDNFAKYKDVKSELICDFSENSNPLVTIAIPTYKRTDTLKEAIDSALNQKNYENYEVIIVDNEDNFDIETATERLIKSYKTNKIRYFKNKQNLGMFGNWNRCIELAKGKWFSLLHDDDLLEENYLEAMTCVISRDNKIRFVTPSHWFLDQRSGNSILKGKFVSKKNSIVRLSLIDYFLSHPVSNVGPFFDRDLMLESGGFNQDFFPITDYVFHTFFHLKYGSYRFLQPLGKYRFQCNESLKQDVAIVSLTNVYLFRNFLNDNFFRSKLFNIYNKVFTNHQIITVKQKFPIINSSELRAKFEISWFYDSKILIILIKIFFKLYNLIRLKLWI